MPELLAELPVSVRNAIALTDLLPTTSVDFGVVLFHGEVEALQDALRRVPDCDGPIVKVLCMAPGAIDIPLEALVTDVSGGEAVMATLGRLRAIRCHP